MILSFSHLVSMGNLFIVRTLTALPESVTTLCSPDLCVIPTHVACVHRGASFFFCFPLCCGRASLAHTCSPNSTMRPRNLRPPSLSCPVLLSWPTAKRVCTNAACSTIHSIIGCFELILIFSLFPRPISNFLSTTKKSCISFSIAPLACGS